MTSLSSRVPNWAAWYGLIACTLSLTTRHWPLTGTNSVVGTATDVCTKQAHCHWLPDIDHSLAQTPSLAPPRTSAPSKHNFSQQQQNNDEPSVSCCHCLRPGNFVTKIGYFDYILRRNMHAKFCGKRPRGVCPTPQLWNIMYCDSVYLPFPSLPFFLVVAYSKNGWTYLIDQYIKRCVFSQGCAFRGEKIIFNI